MWPVPSIFIFFHLRGEARNDIGPVSSRQDGGESLPGLVQSACVQKEGGTKPRTSQAPLPRNSRWTGTRTHSKGEVRDPVKLSDCFRCDPGADTDTDDEDTGTAEGRGLDHVADDVEGGDVGSHDTDALRPLLRRLPHDLHPLQQPLHLVRWGKNDGGLLPNVRVCVRGGGGLVGSQVARPRPRGVWRTTSLATPLPCKAQR